MKRLFIISLISLFMIVACQQNEELVSEENAIVTFNNKELKKVGLTSKRGNTKTISFTITYRSKSNTDASRNCFINKLNLNLISFRPLDLYREIITVEIFELNNRTVGSGNPTVRVDDDEEQKTPHKLLRVTEVEFEKAMNNCRIQDIIFLLSLN